ncbi:hypothetical protein [Pseudobacteriovorax antillogorgiicola]|uniref:Uncharacterized protein n=1 Tax=Pseudobacteriovorax antillogorgiicola TaxID=1513793 RepID=A0A1Y6CL74_9BACT|nr:hypothetical protein [Pseudobacteriovorax antillogorgiicola]TCS45884.1 hypothetical protein EDD56_12647 [Pseudobacteriovorax antillogorgiicola]SMF71207.1 hypothetical protein SAMN06296036_12651 [Pseudobacteriovorax antillogorgiicola]
MTSFGARLVTAILIWYLSSLSFVNAAPIPSKWVTIDAGDNLLIDPSPYLTAKQKKLIYSGLPAYSSVALVLGGKHQDYVLKSMSCAIQYDLWDEKIVLLYTGDGSPRPLKSIDDYYRICVAFRLKASAQITSLLSTAQTLKIKMSFTQISGETTEEIKEWLVGQQSSVLKGLFSHMLGDLKMEESLELPVHLPKKRPQP